MTFKGPFGLWPWPILSAILNIVQSGRGSRPQGRITPFKNQSTIVRNNETIVWQDWEGKERIITVEREIE